MSTFTEPIKQLTGFRLFWATMWARAYPRMIGAMREKSWMFFETLLPLMGTVSYVFVYRAVDAPEEFIGFVVVGGAMTAFWLNVLWSMAAQLYWDKDAGNLELYILAPGPLMAILMGMSVGGMIFASTRAFTILVITSLLFHVSYDTSNLLLVVPIFFVTLAALYGMGMMFASVFLASGREAWHLSSLMQEPIYLASGLYFPVKALGSFVAAAASVIPLTLGLDAIRQLLFSPEAAQGLLSPIVELGILVVLAVLFITGASLMLAKLEEIGRTQGRLTERRR